MDMMNSSAKDAKNAAKAQKKIQKSNKKQQQQQQKAEMGNKNVKNINSSSTISEPLQTMNNGTNKLSAQKSKVGAAQINNNNNEMQNNYNISKKLREQQEATARSILPGYENAPKFERSNSFSIKGTFNKIISSITGSKENLTRVEDDTPYKFTRSRSMIMLRRPNRRSFVEPQLEQLSEEVEKSGDPMSPASTRKNSLETTDSSGVAKANAIAAETGSTTNETKPGDFKTPRRQNSQPYTSTPVQEHDVKLQRQPSTLSLAPGEGNGVPFNPQLHFQKRRSNTLLGSFRALTGRTVGKEKKEKLNPKWSASLQSLQAIDNMVSYENMSFIDYDKFNGYEKQLEKHLSTLSLMENQPEAPTAEQVTPPTTRLRKTPSMLSVGQPSPLNTPQTVVRRRKPSSSFVRKPRPSDRNSLLNGSYNFDTDYEHNLDKPRNVYRDSLDSRKLELLNDISRDSFVLDKQHIVDVLNLEDGSVGKRRPTGLRLRGSVPPGDTVDASAVVQVSQPKLYKTIDNLNSRR